MTADSNDATTLAAFLRARRAQLAPDQVGLPPGRSRRVAGLRREELALLAGVSVDYYTRLEQGRDTRPSDEVLDALARALRLDSAGRTHLHDLARAVRVRRRARPAKPVVTPSVRQVIDSMHGVPAMVQSPHMDILAVNRLASALYDGLGDLPDDERNMIRLVFLDDRFAGLFADWPSAAADSVAWLRATVGADPDHPRAAELIGELSIHSPDFRRLWARHQVREHHSGAKQFLHPLVGDLTLDWNVFTLPGDSGMLITYSAMVGTPDHERLLLLDTLATPTGDDHAASRPHPRDTREQFR